MALAFATGDRGGCHRRARPVETEAVVDPGWTPDERAAVVANEQDRRAALWCLVGDDFLAESFGPAAAAEWLAALGDERDPEDLRLLGERVWTLTRLFNLRGVRPRRRRAPGSADAGTDRAGETDEEPDDGLDPDAFEDLLDRYYAHRGWDREGRPTARLLDRLGLADLPDAATPVGSAAEVPDSGGGVD